MNQETLLKANAQLYGTLTIIGGVLDGYVDHEMDNGRQPNANLGVAAGLATKVLNDVEKLFDESYRVVHPDEFHGPREHPWEEITMSELEAAAKARFEDINTAIKAGLDAFTVVMGGVVNEIPFIGHPNKSLGLVIHTKSGFNHPFATRQFCKLCGDS